MLRVLRVEEGWDTKHWAGINLGLERVTSYIATAVVEEHMSWWMQVYGYGAGKVSWGLNLFVLYLLGNYFVPVTVLGQGIQRSVFTSASLPWLQAPSLFGLVKALWAQSPEQLWHHLPSRGRCLLAAQVHPETPEAKRKDVLGDQPPLAAWVGVGCLEGFLLLLLFYLLFSPFCTNQKFVDKLSLFLRKFLELIIIPH